ncbi:MAG: SpaA isopeptide-forming pilin-related protein [Atopobium sp.]|uniref:SpaA isopeptide-forming pilin-related protein n=1 Tax=Atopobium sp. TaxID=1872650 RepID=UPI002A76647A|nr:SpaA isopeptide-forming pilin-related protein [Atopobium sp.]MDY2788624.1 SpaA isopeptide-forming pilin-related protein [Atopobium sp.]
MKKFFVMLFAALLMMNNLSSPALAEDYVDDYRSTTGITGIGVRPLPQDPTVISSTSDSVPNVIVLGSDVSSKLSDVHITHKVRNLADPADVRQDTIKPYGFNVINAEYTATAANTNNAIKPGDYFTIQLDPAARLGGVVNDEVMAVNSFFDGNELVAYAIYEPQAAKVTYVFTDYVNTHEDIKLYNQFIEYPSATLISNNGSYTWTDSFGGISKSETYNIDWGTGASTLNNLKAGAFQHSAQQIYTINPETKRYVQFNNAVFADKTQPVSFRWHNYANPVYDNAQVKVYALPESLSFCDSQVYDTSKLIDVTDSFTVAKKTLDGSSYLDISQTSNIGAYSGKYYVTIDDEYNPDEGVNSMVETVSYDPNKQVFPVDNTTGHISGDIVFVDKAATKAYASGRYTQSVKPTIQKHVKLVKTNPAGEPLQYAEYEVFDAKGNAVDMIVTGKDGIGYSKALDLGTYTIKETKAPEGYELNSKVESVTLSHEGTNLVQVNVVDQKTLEQPTPPTNTPPLPKTSIVQNSRVKPAGLPKTSDDFNVWIPIGVSIVAANICIFAAVLRKKK